MIEIAIRSVVTAYSEANDLPTLTFVRFYPLFVSLVSIAGCIPDAECDLHRRIVLVFGRRRRSGCVMFSWRTVAWALRDVCNRSARSIQRPPEIRRVPVARLRLIHIAIPVREKQN